MEDILKEFNKLKKEQEKLVTEIRKKAKDVFKKVNNTIFEKTDRITKYTFTAYTPYFNDGDECTYSANLGYPYIYIKDNDDNEIEIDLYIYAKTEIEKIEKIKEQLIKYYSQIKIDQDLLNAILLIYNLSEIFSDEDIRFIFGDHVKVECSKDEISTSYYDHD